MTQDYRLNSVCRVLWPGEGLHEDEWWQGFTARAKDSTWPEAARQMMPYSSWKLIGLIGDRFSDPSFLDFFDDWIILDHSYILHQVGVSWYGHLRFPPWFWLALETVLLLWSCRSVDPWSFTTFICFLETKCLNQIESGDFWYLGHAWRVSDSQWHGQSQAGPSMMCPFQMMFVL